MASLRLTFKFHWKCQRKAKTSPIFHQPYTCGQVYIVKPPLVKIRKPGLVSTLVVSMSPMVNWLWYIYLIITPPPQSVTLLFTLVKKTTFVNVFVGSRLFLLLLLSPSYLLALSIIQFPFSDNFRREVVLIWRFFFFRYGTVELP